MDTQTINITHTFSSPRIPRALDARTNMRNTRGTLSTHIVLVATWGFSPHPFASLVCRHAPSPSSRLLTTFPPQKTIQPTKTKTTETKGSPKKFNEVCRVIRGLRVDDALIQVRTAVQAANAVSTHSLKPPGFQPFSLRK
jgi:hypothetical protein